MMMISKGNVERLAGALLVTSFVAFLGHFVALKAHLTLPLVVLFVLMYGVLIFLSAPTLYLTFRAHERTLALFGASGLAAHGLFVVLVCAMILARFKFAQEFTTTGGAETDAVVAAARALGLAMDKIRTSAFLFLGLGLVPLGVLIAWSGAVARWVGWLGVVGASLGFLGVLAGLFDVLVGGPASIPIAVLMMFVFMLILGVRLVVRETREATVSRA